MQFIYFELYLKNCSCSWLVGLTFKPRKGTEEVWSDTTSLLLFRVCLTLPDSSRKREDVFFVVAELLAREEVTDDDCC